MQHLEFKIDYDIDVGDITQEGVDAVMELEHWVAANSDKPLALVLEVHEQSFHIKGTFHRTTKARFNSLDDIGQDIQDFIDFALSPDAFEADCFLGVYGEPSALTLLKASWPSTLPRISLMGTQ